MTLTKFDYVVIGGGMVGTALGSALSEAGMKVAIVEKGPTSVQRMVAPVPHVQFAKRRHSGCENGRHQVLGGNAAFWGGGLMRPPSHDSGLVFADLSAELADVERELGIPRAPSRERFAVSDAGIGPCDLAEICVLPGKRRNTARSALQRVKPHAGCAIFTDSTIAEFRSLRDGAACRVESVEVRRDGRGELLSAREFVVAAGALDTNVLVLRRAGDLHLSRRFDEIGASLHDHWSLPLATVRLSEGEACRELLAPRFQRGHVYGRHFELRCEGGWGARGFVHFQFLFDEVAPYREIKEILNLRQRGADMGELIGAAFPMLGRAGQVAGIGIERFVKGRLRLGERLPIVATLDFESCPRPEQMVRIEGDGARMSWDILPEDERSFVELLGKARLMLNEIARTYGLTVEYDRVQDGERAAIAYLHEKASDAYHLGGGLAAAEGASGLVDRELRLAGTANVHIISSAVFARPGVVNPTLTLFALAKRFVLSQLKTHGETC